MTILPTRERPGSVSHSPLPSGNDELRNVILQAPALICVTRGPRHVLEACSELFARSHGGGHAIGVPIDQACPALSPARLAAMTRTFETGEPYVDREGGETIITERGEEDRLLDLTIQPLRTGDGTIYGLMTHAVDVTEGVRARQELADVALALERSNRELDSFAYAASHDLRAPLRGIANLAQWIEEDLVGGGDLKSETREMLELMRGRMHRMEGLIEGLLQYSRAGRTHGEPEMVDVGRLVRDVIDLLSPPPGVTFHVESDFPTLQTERLLLQQVFMNLIGNAIKHANRDDAEIAVGSRRVGPFYEFFVNDNGPGIAPEYHERIWGIFQTLEARDRVEGAGIGLALVKKIVEAQRGRAWVESAPGAGSTFRFLWRK